MDFLALVGPLAQGVGGVAFAIVWGALWGSFANVVIERVPKGMSVVRPPSRCFSCDEPVRFFDNIPIVSYLVLRGHCRHCRARFSPRYLLVEVLSAALALAMHQSFVVAEADLKAGIARFLITTLFCDVCIAIAFIDFDTRRIPNVITYPGMPLFATLSLFMGLPNLWDGAVGAVGGYLLIRLLADGWRLLFGRQGMGYGDAKLLALIGGLMGWQVLYAVMFLASLQGSLIGVTALVVVRRSVASPKKEDSGPDRPVFSGSASASDSLRKAAIPFGPFLCLAAVELLIIWPQIPALAPWLFPWELFFASQ